jgi:glycosyltransferase involved in cell wall biosynthesis
VLERSPLAIVIPCYNEAGTLRDVIRGCAATGDVFVIDDGSTDGSRSIAHEEGAILVETGGRTGYDKVIELGLRETFTLGYRWVVTVDADGEHDPALVADYARVFRETDTQLVLGIRPAPQRLAEWVVCFYCRWRFGIRDILCGMKGYSRDVLQRYFAEGNPNLVNTWPALLWVAAGFSFAEIQVTGRRRLDKPRFSSRYRANVAIIKMLGPISALRKNRYKNDA